MLIEDDFDTQILFEECLRAEAFDTICVENGEAALEEIDSTGLPDLIFMDLNFPGMTAGQFVSKLRERKDGLGVPVVIISGDADIQEICEKLKVQHFLRKPFDIDLFIDSARKWSQVILPQTKQSTH